MHCHAGNECIGVAWRVRQHAFLWLHNLIRVLKPARFSFFILILTIIALLTGPGQDLLRSAGERPLNDVVHWFLLAVGVCFWAACIWYWARVILRFRYNGAEEKEDPQRFFTLRMKAPRWLGTTALGGLSIALLSAARSYQSTDWFNLSDPAFKLWTLFFGALAMTVLFGAFVAFRTRLLAYLSSTPLLPQALRSFFKPLPESSHYSQDAHLFSDLAPATRTVTKISWIVSIGLLVMFTINQVVVAVAPLFGSLTIFFFALGVWAFFGSFLVLIARRTRLPIVTLGLVGMLAFSFINDNHRIRTLETPEIRVGPSTSQEHARAWLDTRLEGEATDESAAPIFLVAAEGGGVRAAYWTSLVLSTLQDTLDDVSGGSTKFSDHLYAISGASGGSIGAGIYTALVAEDVRDHAAFFAEDASYVQHTQTILERDYLSPILAKFVVSDLVQRFLPLPIQALDRGAALELTFEDAWRSQFEGSNTLGQPFGALWLDAPYRVPSLVVNATHVDSGRRMLTSNLPVDQTFADALDLRKELGAEMRLSTALHNGARFPYVNPAGTIRAGNRWLGRIRGRVVDGGYFDNSGATSLTEVLAILEKAGVEDRIRVIWISNSPLVRTEGHTALIEPTFLSGGLYESFTPPKTILNTRDARARQAVNELKNRVGADRLYTFALCERMQGEDSRKAALPLSWDLSEQAMTDMTNQLANGCAFAANHETIGKIIKLFGR